MKITIELTDKLGGTVVAGVHEGRPPGVAVEGNEMGWRMAPAKPARLVGTM